MLGGSGVGGSYGISSVPFGIDSELARVHRKSIDQLIHLGRMIARSGCAPEYKRSNGELGSSGNLSVRTERGCLITVTGSNLGQLRDNDFVELVDLDESVEPRRFSVVGAGWPSSDSLIHWKLYKLRPDVQCIVHGHDSVVLNLNDVLQMPCTEREEEYGSQDLWKLIRPLAESKSEYFLIRNHGFIAVGPTVGIAGGFALFQTFRASCLYLERNVGCPFPPHGGDVVHLKVPLRHATV